MQLSEKIEKLRKDNYDTWSIVIESILRAKQLWTYCERPIEIDDEKVEDVEEEAELSSAETAKHEEAKAIIYTSLDRSEILKTGVCTYAYQLWNKIHDNHRGAQDNLRNIALSEFLSFAHKRGESIIQYCGRFELALSKLEATGEEVKENMKFWAFRNTLPTDVKATVNFWMMANPKGKITNMITSLKIQFHESNGKEDDPKGVALYGHSDRDSKPSKEAEKLTCNYCGIAGHRWRECRKKRSNDTRKKQFGSYRNGHNSGNNNNYNNNNNN